MALRPAAAAQGGPTEIHPWVAAGTAGLRFGVANGPWGDGPALLDFVRTVEELGFGSYWGIDHPLGMGADCWTTLAALAVVTRTIRLGSLVSCVFYRSPALLARQAADVDVLSKGRLVLGLGIGDSEREFERLRIPRLAASARQDALAEAVDIVRGLWGDTPFTYDGRYGGVSDAMLAGARPVQRPWVPLLIAGGGERGTLRQVARYADVSNFGETQSTGGARAIEDVRRKFAALARHCRDVDRPFESVLRTHSTLMLILGETEARVRAKLEHVPAGKLVSWRDSLVAGTPRDAAARYRSLAQAGMQYFITFIFGNDLETVRLLAEQVVPELQSAPVAASSAQAPHL